jgi:flagellar hook assembly protein FlgD
LPPLSEAFDVERTDQLGNTTQIFDEIDANQGGNVFNSDGAYQKFISLGTKAAGPISFDVFADGFNDINNFSPEGNMTLSVSGQQEVPESSSLLGLLAVSVLGAGTVLARKKA